MQPEPFDVAARCAHRNLRDSPLLHISTFASPQQPIANAAPAAAELIRVSPDEIELAFDQPVSAITPGQSLVMYDGERVIGGGLIERARRGSLPVLAA